MKTIINYIIEKQNFLIKGHTKQQNKQILRFVDLGLPSKTLWADCNLGANKPEEIGNYYAWGETETKDIFDKDNYKLRDNKKQLTKYTRDDGLMTLEDEDDAAFVITGGKAIMPTRQQIVELQDNTDLEWTEDYNNSKIAGFIIKSKKNKNHIFIPVNKHKKGNKAFYAAKNVQTTFAVWTKRRDSASAWAQGMIGIYQKASQYRRSELFITWTEDDYNREDGLPIRAVKNK